MNRRFFTFGLGALLGVPKVPLASKSLMPVLATGQLKLATMLSRAHDYCSPEFLMRHLKVDKVVATQVQQALIQSNVISAPSASGFSYAVNPMPLSRLSNSVPIQTKEIVQKVKEKVSDHLTSEKCSEPDDGENQADDGIPSSHRYTDEVPSDFVTTRDGRSKDLSQ
jgi:hypothetical protein